MGEDLGCYGTAAAASLGWELLGQGAQAIKDDALLALTSRCHPLTCARCGGRMWSLKDAQSLQIGEQRELAVCAGYYELRGILAPIGDAQRQRNASLLPPDLAAAYDQCMAG